MNKILTFSLLITLNAPFSTWSQDRYFVYLKDKSSDSYAFTLDDPQSFLSQKAIDRREKQSILLDSMDLPVDPTYVDSIRADASVFFTSKWLNGVLVQMDSSTATRVGAYDFVDSVRLAARGVRLQSQSMIMEEPSHFEEPPSVGANTDIQLLMLGADKMVSDSTLGQGMTIAVFDNGFTGVNRYSPFQALWKEDRIIATKDFVENSGNVFQYGAHGTSVFSIIGASYQTEEASFTGIAHQANFILCVTEDDLAENTIEEYNWVLAAEYADSAGVDVINSSLGYRDFDLPEHDYDFEDLDGRTAIISQAARLAARKGIVVVTSAGNSGRRASPANSINHPADADSILTVGSVDPDFTYSAFSSIGPTTDGRIKPDVAAFGNGTALIRGNGSIERGSGTSFSSPLIAGFAAAVWQINPDWTAQEVIANIKGGSHNYRNPDNFLGYGVPYYGYIVEDGTKAINVDQVISGEIQFYPNPFIGNTLYIKSEDLVEEEMGIKIVDPLGKSILSRTFSPEAFQQVIEIPLQTTQQGIYYLFLQSGQDQKVVKLLKF